MYRVSFRKCQGGGVKLEFKRLWGGGGGYTKGGKFPQPP